MKLPAVTADLGIEFDTAQFDWWKPIGRAWRLEAAGISVLYGARVGVLGLQLTAAIGFYDRDALDRDDQVRAGVDDDDRAELVGDPWCEICRTYHPASTPHVDDLRE